MFLNEFRKYKLIILYSIINVCIRTWINRNNDTPDIKNIPKVITCALLTNTELFWFTMELHKFKIRYQLTMRMIVISVYRVLAKQK